MDSVRRTSLGSHRSIEALSFPETEAEWSRIERLHARKRVAPQGVELMTDWVSVLCYEYTRIDYLLFFFSFHFDLATRNMTDDSDC